MINVYKSPISKEKYANLFLDKIPESVRNVCLLFIGHSETVHYIMSQKPEIDFTVIDGSDVTEALPYIYTADNLKERITFEESDCEDETFLEKLETCFENYIMNNMSFDLIIANPPYGKIGTQILQKLQTLTPQVVALEQSADIKRNKLFQYIDKIEGPYNCFEDAAVAVYAFSLKNKKVHSMEWESWSADYRYDKNIAPFYKKNFARKEPWKYHCWESEEKWRRLFNEDKTFLLTLRTVFDGVHSGEDALDVYWNKKHICKFTPGERTTGGFSSVDKQGRYAAQGYEFETKEEKENIINWWYNSKIASKLCWGLKKQSFGRGYLPRVDWSHPWTDQEILAEIGLPEDFLEKE